MAAGTLRCRVASSAAVSAAFALGGTWVLVVFKIADATGRCSGLEGSVWADDTCRHLMSYPPAVAAVSLLLMLWLWRRELNPEDHAEAADGRKDPELGLHQGPERRGLRESDSMAVGGIIVIYSFCVLLMFLGGMVRSAGESLLLKDPADKGAAAQVRTGIVIGDAGLLSFEFGHCFLFIPYMLLRVRRVLSR